MRSPFGLIVWLLLGFNSGYTQPYSRNTTRDALAYLFQQQSITKKGVYTHINYDTFCAQLANRIQNPDCLHQGRTHFCWATIPMAYLYQNEPKAMIDATLSLYRRGDFALVLQQDTLHWKADTPIIRAVGNTSFNQKNDRLSGQYLDQMVLLLMASQYASWLNVDRTYSPGNQISPFWAGALLKKEARVWRDLGFETKQVGHDARWIKRHKHELIQRFLQSHDGVVLYINRYAFENEWIGPKSFKWIPPVPLIPSHFIWLKSIQAMNRTLWISFWDRNGNQVIKMPKHRFQSTVFGAVAFKKKENKLN
ncbi:MAG: hypothetical protein ACR2IL_05625 [Chitinophagaceae bacterium]